MKSQQFDQALKILAGVLERDGKKSRRAKQDRRGLCQTNANQVEFVTPGFRWTAQNTCDFQQPLGD